MFNNCGCNTTIIPSSSNPYLRIYTENTPSISLSGIGKKGNSLKGDVKLSGLSGNILEMKPDGLYAASSGGGGIIDNIYTANGTLLSNRIVSQAGFYLNFSGGSFYTSGNIGDTPVSGTGQRMMWIPAKQAFRAGNPLGTAWDDANIGVGSMVLGRGSIASGINSVALGANSSATGENSFAAGGPANGVNSISLGPNFGADGYASVAIGNAAYCLGDYSVAIGQESQVLSQFSVAISPRYAMANAQYSAAVGYSAITNGEYSTSVGYQNQANGFESMAAGSNCTAYSSNSFTFGRNLWANHYGELVVGMSNYNPGFPIENGTDVNARMFTVGNGTGTTTGNPNDNKSNAFVIYRGGLDNAKIAVNPGHNITVPTNTMRIFGDLRVDTLTAVPTKLLGATGANVLGALTLGPGISIVGGQLQVATAGGGNIYSIDGTLSGARAVNMAGYSLQFTNAGLFRIEDTNGVGDDGVYDFNQGIDFLTYNASFAANISANTLNGVTLAYNDIVTPARNVKINLNYQSLILDNPTSTTTYFKIADYSVRSGGSVLALGDPLTGEVEWKEGATGSFISNDGFVITVDNGLITDISPV